MKFRETGKGKRKVKASLDLTPLIDVVFLLIIFFMLSSTFVVQSSIQVELPKSEGTRTLEQKDLSLTISLDPGGPGGGGLIYVNQDPIETWEALAERLSNERAKRDNPLLLIRSDDQAPSGRIVRVLGIARSVGIERYGFAAKPLEAETG